MTLCQIPFEIGTDFRLPFLVICALFGSTMATTPAPLQRLGAGVMEFSPPAEGGRGSSESSNDSDTLFLRSFSAVPFVDFGEVITISISLTSDAVKLNLLVAMSFKLFHLRI